ncbi:hypothetical protein [Psychroserpens sp. NJDZ02]|uniref:hypothetical protein n=1 Tax=Psychroserpens sp. NJDZ02 TaxID=2570561 RepID=UPI0010A8EAA2|nr:hypothetical protein [Psychroserpens sp. NJDZ02]QCE43178.1 hypothetical protein E9099_17730 [Psychroserpens sp. NJDZ02]
MTIENIKHRLLDKEELQEIDFEYQAGIEFIFWYYDMGDTVSNEDLITGINVVLSKLRAGLDYPVAEYESDREVTTLMGFTLGQILHESFNWKWIYVNDSDLDFGGYTIVNPETNFGISIEDLFFKTIFYKKEIHFTELGALLLDHKAPKLDHSGFEIYQPWKYDYSALFTKRNSEPEKKNSTLENVPEQKIEVKKSFWKRLFGGQ